MAGAHSATHTPSLGRRNPALLAAALAGGRAAACTATAQLWRTTRHSLTHPVTQPQHTTHTGHTERTPPPLRAQPPPASRTLAQPAQCATHTDTPSLSLSQPHTHTHTADLHIQQSQVNSTRSCA